MLNVEQKESLLNFVFRPSNKGSNHNPYVYGKSWAVGDCYTDGEKKSFQTEWNEFKTARPDISAQIPYKGH